MNSLTREAASADPLQRFWHDSLAEADPEVAAIIGRELGRQRDRIELIASENIASPAVLEATGSVFTNKYAEGYPGRRYYGGCDYADEVETLAIERAKHAVRLPVRQRPAQLGQPDEPGGVPRAADPRRHLHGARPRRGWPPDPRLAGQHERQVVQRGALRRARATTSGSTWTRSVALALEHKPKLIIAGATAYPRHWDFAAFRAIADEVGAWLLADMSHFSGLVAGGAHPSPFPHAHVVTTTTHKTPARPALGVILTNDEALAKKFNSAVFPGMQGGPLVHVIAAKAVAFGEALTARVQGLCPLGGRERQGARREPRGARAQDRLGRHRQPPDAGRSLAQAGHRQSRRSRARPCAS